MKLIFCPHCQDVVKLHQEVTTCKCGQSQGAYLDEINAVYSGVAVPLGIDNSSLANSLSMRKASGPGIRFKAFVISIQCSTFKRVQHIGSTKPAP